MVRADGALSTSFSTTSGVRQGCLLAPALFCRAIDWIMERIAQMVGVVVGGRSYTDLDYADDVTLFATSTPVLGSALEAFEETASHLGLHVSWQKTKIQNLGAGAPTADIMVGNQVVEGWRRSRIWALYSPQLVAAAQTSPDVSASPRPRCARFREYGARSVSVRKQKFGCTVAASLPSYYTVRRPGRY